MTSIKLYEDNAGSLYLYQDGDPVAWRVGQGGNLMDDAEALSYHETDGWTIDTIPVDELAEIIVHPECSLIHTIAVRHDGGLAGGAAARDYVSGRDA